MKRITCIILIVLAAVDFFFTRPCDRDEVCAQSGVNDLLYGPCGRVAIGISRGIISEKTRMPRRVVCTTGGMQQW